ncbi:hypothetical protein N9219_00650 [bacterium]|nr:hypothetical protein [bacterium]
MSRTWVDKTKFILLTTQRSGSTFIRLWLNSHKNIRCHSEVFLKKYSFSDGFQSYLLATKKGRDLSTILQTDGYGEIILEYLDELYNNPAFSAPWTDMTKDIMREYQPNRNFIMEKAVGFHLMYDQLANCIALQRWITSQNVFILHLVRQNELKKLISRKFSRKTRIYHSFEIPQNFSPKKVHLDPKKILTQLSKIVGEKEGIKKMFRDNPSLEITYELFFSDYYQESAKVFNFLQIKRGKTEFPKYLNKILPDTLEDLIENYNEIAIALKGTPYDKFLC